MKSLPNASPATMRSASDGMVRRMSGALLSGSYRYDIGEWESSDDGGEQRARPHAARARATATRAGRTSRPCSSRRRRPPTPADRPGIPPPAPRRRRDDLRAGAGRQPRRCRLAIILNGKIEAVVIYDGIPVPSQHDVPLLRDFLDHPSPAGHGEPRAARNRRDSGAAHQARSPRARHLPVDRPRGGKAGRRPGRLDDPARVLRSRGADWRCISTSSKASPTAFPRRTSTI